MLKAAYLILRGHTLEFCARAQNLPSRLVSKRLKAKGLDKQIHLFFLLISVSHYGSRL